MALSVRPRRAKVREIVAEWLNKYGARSINRVKMEESTKPPKPSPPCRCNCAFCIQCAVKCGCDMSATVGDSTYVGKAENRITNQTIETKIQTAMEILFESGQDWMNTNRSLSDFVRKIHSGFEIEELRLRDAVKRANAPKLKLIGGQSK